MRDNYVSKIGKLYKETQTSPSDLIDKMAESICELAKFYVECGEKLPISVCMTEVGVGFASKKEDVAKLTKILKEKHGIITDGSIHINLITSGLSVAIVDFL